MYPRFVAVCVATGAHGVGFCPGVAFNHLIGHAFPSGVRYFLVTDLHFMLCRFGGEWGVFNGYLVERLGGVNHLFSVGGAA